MPDDDQYKLVYHKLNSKYPDHENMGNVFAWDGGRYVFVFWADTWKASEYFDSLTGMPEYAREIVSNAINERECWDVWDNERKAPVFTPNMESFKAYINIRAEKEGGF